MCIRDRVCYVNSTVEIKSWSDVCVTSSNAVKIVSELPQQHVLFIPDQNLLAVHITYVGKDSL